MHRISLSVSFSEWQCHTQDSEVHDKPFASEEANGKWGIKQSGGWTVPIMLMLDKWCMLSSSGSGCPAPWKSNSPQDWNQGEACQNVQDHTWCGVRLRFQDSIRWRQDNRFRHGLRFTGLCQEEWAQIQTSQSKMLLHAFSFLIKKSLHCELISCF